MLRKFTVSVFFAVTAGFLLVGCSGSRQYSKEPPPAVRIDLAAHGLPKDFFRAHADTKCANQIIGYRFVVWLNNETVAVGFNTSPNCRPSPKEKVHGMARVLAFGVQGTLKASRDLPYDADGDGVLVTEGEGRPGPGGTLLFRIEEAGESKSGIILLDANLKDTARLNRFLEQTTFVDHALVFQKGFTLSGPRTYDTFDGSPLLQTGTREKDWPIGTMDRKFGEHGLAYMLCEQELKPNVWVSTNVVYANARRRCRMVVEPDGQPAWDAPLKEDGTAVIVGLMADGSVVGQVPVKGRKDRQLVIWKKDQPVQTLPWIAPQFCGAIESATADMSQYATSAKEDCESDVGRWTVFDRTIPTPIVDRPFPTNGRAALSPDGLHYASFESGELRIYSLPRLD
ncbi:MAG: hypothetical protein WBL63_14595 [Candidatus Acidiferrum sp.]